MISVATVTSMHEDVHQRTGQEGKPNQETKHMGAVLCEKKGAGNCEKARQDQPIS